ncbi:MAG: type IV pilus modification protein PilV [Gammaproteobacteria bacterium]|nr:type IV pilus modification protein PilV [Gammaproteobacteria bacterium]MDE2250213.1 type IV pilus modification protein PilV [Gammaproteobacteria bacterium]
MKSRWQRRRGRPVTLAHGFTLVETMVALVVLAVGMLGIAGLYVTTLKSGGGAIYRMQAVNLAADLADRIRANRGANVAYAGAAADNNCYGAASVDCAPALMAANDLFVWQQQVAAILPGGVGTVVVPPVAAGPYTYTITINWTESGGAPLSYALTLQI